MDISLQNSATNTNLFFYLCNMWNLFIWNFVIFIVSSPSEVLYNYLTSQLLLFILFTLQLKFYASMCHLHMNNSLQDFKQEILDVKLL